MLLYFVMPNIKLKNAVLLIFSLVFYSWGEPRMIILLIISVLLNYCFGLLIERYRGRGIAKAALALSVICSLSSLAVFKYLGFFVDTVNSVLGFEIPVPQLALPIGISFYTFQILTYVIDVYRDKVPAQRSPFRLLLYIACFHQLIAGPIVRYEDIARELDDRHASLDDIFVGVRRFAIGLGKKVLIANLCGEVASQILDSDFTTMTVVSAWFGIILFSLQIYFDFSAYSDMAIGMGRMCGFHYRENFNYPYISRSVTEFWRRWHISLGSFFRDYVYIPLGGNRRHQFFNLLAVWALTGLWHGASMNFVVWGLYFFVFIVLEKFLIGKLLEKLPVISNLYLLFVVICGWGFFYYTDLSDCLSLLSVMLGFSGNALYDSLSMITIQNNLPILIIGILCCLPFAQWFKSLAKGYEERRIKRGLGTNIFLDNVQIAASGALIIASLALSTVMLIGQSYNPFLYFRF